MDPRKSNKNLLDHPIHISVHQLGKKFYQRWIFKDLTLDIHPEEHLALIGANGSGKSTLMHILTGHTLPTQGYVHYTTSDQRKIPIDYWYRYLSWASPAMELYLDISLSEHLNMHFSFKNCILPDPMNIIEILDLARHKNKKLRFFSSGMLQRVKIATALFTQSSVLFLDEPTSFMDEHNTQHTLQLIQEYIGKRIYILASNIEKEYIEFPRSIVLDKK